MMSGVNRKKVVKVGKVVVRKARVEKVSVMVERFKHFKAQWLSGGGRVYNRDYFDEKQNGVELLTTRFTTETWNRSLMFREFCRRNAPKEYEKTFETMYCSPYVINTLPFNGRGIVFELNVTTNELLGIGILNRSSEISSALSGVFEQWKCQMVYNDLPSEERYYSSRYIYTSAVHMSREMLQELDAPLLELLEHYLFKEGTHCKRGVGVTRLPDVIHHKIRDVSGISLMPQIRMWISTHIYQLIAKNIDPELHM